MENNKNNSRHNPEYKYMYRVIDGLLSTTDGINRLTTMLIDAIGNHKFEEIAVEILQKLGVSVRPVDKPGHLHSYWIGTNRKPQDAQKYLCSHFNPRSYVNVLLNILNEEWVKWVLIDNGYLDPGHKEKPVKNDLASRWDYCGERLMGEQEMLLFFMACLKHNKRSLYQQVCTMLCEDENFYANVIKYRQNKARAKSNAKESSYLPQLLIEILLCNTDPIFYLLRPDQKHNIVPKAFYNSFLSEVERRYGNKEVDQPLYQP